jgi:predicted transcriptional regulator
MGMATFHNLTSYRRHANEDICTLIKSGLIKSIHDYNVHIHPFGTSRIDSYLDYAPLINLLFEQGIEDITDNMEYPQSSSLQLTDNEKQILATIVENPSLSDSKLSEVLGMSRPTVSEKRNNFIKQQLIRKRNIPQIRQIGAELIVLYNFKLNPRLTDNQRQKTAKEMLDNYKPFIQICDKIDCTGMFVAKNFEDFKKLNEKHLYRLIDNEDINEDIQLTVIPVKNVKYRITNFAPAIRYTLNIQQVI